MRTLIWIGIWMWWLTVMGFGQSAADHSFHPKPEITTENFPLYKDTFDRLMQVENFRAIEIGYELAMYHLQQRHSDLAIGYLNQVIVLARKSNDANLLTQPLEALSGIYFVRESFHKALTIYKELSQQYWAMNDTVNAITKYKSIASSFRSINQLDSAVYYIHLALDAGQETLGNFQYANVCQVAAFVYRDEGKFDLANEYMMKSLRLFEQEEKKYSIISTLNCMSILHLDQLELKKARHYGLLSLQQAQHENIKLYEADALVTLGEIFLKQETLDSALIYFQRALEINQQKGLTKGSASTKIRIGKVYLQKGKPEEALEIFQEAYTVFENRQSYRKMATVKHYMGLAHLQQQDHNQAIGQLEASKHIADSIKFYIELPKIYADLARAYARNGQFEKAYGTRMAYHTIQDSLHNLEKSRIIKEIETQYQVGKKEDNIAQLQEAALLRSSQLRQQKNFIIGLIIGAGLLLTLSIILYRYLSYNRLIAKQQAELDQHKIKELERNRRLVAMQAMIQGQEQERKRVARDLHDGLGGLLSTVKLKFDAAKEEHVSFGKSTAYQEGNELLDMACYEVRKIAHNMMPGTIAKFGLVAAIRDMCIALEKVQNMEVNFQTINFKQNLPEALSVTIYRIVQELLNNVAKHAEATEVIVQLSCHHQKVHLIVEDNGVGFDVEAAYEKDGIGVSSVCSRVRYLNGHMEVESFPDKGTTYNIQFPVKQGEGSITSVAT